MAARDVRAPRPSLTVVVHYKGSLDRKHRSRCLNARTLALLGRGAAPGPELQRVREHLPQCSKCLGTVAAAVRRRALAGSPGHGREARGLASDRHPGRLFRSLAVAISLLALGSSATCWYLDPAVPGESRSNEGMPPPSVARGAMTDGE